MRYAVRKKLKKMAMLTAGVLLLLVFCAHILYLELKNAISRIPAPLASRNVRKALKVGLRHRQVSAVLLLSLILAADIHANPGPHPKTFFRVDYAKEM